MANAALLLLLLVQLSARQISASSLSKCPHDCYCDLDPSGRYYTECNEPGMSKFNEYSFDPKMEVIIIRNPKNSLSIGPLFSRFKKLETLVIVGANVPDIGEKSFWGVRSLRTLDLSSNNLTQIKVMNFYDLNNLTELNLSGNKLTQITSGTFSFLTVS
jgi:Leucine-rich repeat (LRR) protein